MVSATSLKNDPSGAYRPKTMVASAPRSTTARSRTTIRTVPRYPVDLPVIGRDGGLLPAVFDLGVPGE